ncbi:MAG: HmuY family protein [Bacteroidaceae bacterium]|nr:HmuY family protein [Bacteroidaceae bacterium]
MNKKIIYILSLLVSVTLFSCRDKHEEREPVPVKRELTLTLEPGKWIYYNISDSSVIGTSDIGDNVQDAEWGARMDWDIALSESGLRTNSGTSGRGNGGLVLLSDSLYNALKKESSFIALEYKADTLDVSVIRPLKD